MPALVVRRLLAIVPLLFVVSIVAFLSLQLLPGDPVLVRLGAENATAEQYAALEKELGLDRPVPVQYARWLGGALRGDFGISLSNGQEVSEAVWARMPVTLSVATGAILVSIVVGIGAGVIGGATAGSPVDRGVTFGATVGLAVPHFWAAILLVRLFSLTLGWFPATGYTGLTESPGQWFRSIALPCIALGLSSAAVVARQTRSGLAAALQSDYARTAVAKGAGPVRVVVRHALKNACIPVVTVVAFQFTALLGGALVVEQVFNLPGLGSLAVRSVRESDVTMMQGVVMYTALVVVVVNLLTDVCYGLLDPRVRVA